MHEAGHVGFATKLKITNNLPIYSHKNELVQ